MFSDEQLIKLNKRGLIPGPTESDKQYYQRKVFCEKFFEDPSAFFSDSIKNQDFVKRKDLDWAYAKLIKTYDIAPDYLVAYYSDRDLYFFQGACTWIFENHGHSMAIIQLRKALKNKKYYI